MTMSTVLHEAAHNLGPLHGYRVDEEDARCSAAAAHAEELKAETELYSDGLLRGVLSKEDAGLYLRGTCRGCSADRGWDGRFPGPAEADWQLAAIQMGF